MLKRLAERSYGIIPVWRDGVRWLMAVVQHRDGHWGFPKGHPEPGESPLETARRELAEELSITDVDIDEGHELESVYSFERDGALYDKTVTFWPGWVKDQTARAQPGELRDYRWVTPEEARTLLFANETQLVDNMEHIMGGK